MEEFNINLVGNDEEIKKEEILNDFDFNYIPVNNLPISYFPLNNGLLSNELKKINNENLTGGEVFSSELTNYRLTINDINSPYNILVKKNIDCILILSGTSKKIRLNKGIYTIIYNFNSNNIIQKNNIDIYKENKGTSTSIILDFIDSNKLSNVKKISSLRIKKIDIINSTGLNIETTLDNPNYKLLVYSSGSNNRLILNKDITCDILIVGGGGSGGRNDGMEGGGGGGGGGVGLGTIILKEGTYTITIGNGGSNGNNGDNTIITNDKISLTAFGGGGGGINGIGKSGGSGGGGTGYMRDYSGGISTKGTSIDLSVIFYGNNGGFGYNQSGGGGGGGAGSEGINSIKNNKNGGNGGNGISSLITGKSIYYGGGGGGAIGGEVNNLSAGSNIRGLGGLGGGGDGGNRNNPKNGDTNTGGGGGGSSMQNGGSGGSGIVIIRVKKEDVEDEIDISNELLTTTDSRIINEINNILEKKMIELNNDEKPYNYLAIFPLIILVIIIWLFIFLFLLKFVHHYFASIYIYILLLLIIFLLIFGSLWFLYTNNDLL